MVRLIPADCIKDIDNLSEEFSDLDLLRPDFRALAFAFPLPDNPNPLSVRNRNKLKVYNF
jgi:hypothetical protein